MNKDANQKLLDSISLLLVISFFIFKNILLVLSGICIALLSINKDKINKISKSVQKLRSPKEERKQMDSKCIERSDTITTKGDTLSLVERIEEFGFIPSPEKE